MSKIPIKNKIKNLKPSSTLAINEKSKDLIKKGKKIYRFGFGQSPFPVPEKIVECLKLNAAKKAANKFFPENLLPYMPNQLIQYCSTHLSVDDTCFSRIFLFLPFAVVKNC